MASLTAEYRSARPVLFLDQDVIRVVGRDGEDGDAVCRERLDEGEQDSGLRKRERAFEFQADPAVRRVRRLAEGWLVGQTMESSSAVRVIEVKSPFVAQAGMGASGARRTMA